MSNNFHIIQPQGILDSVHANSLRRDIIDLTENGVKLILIDLQDITFMNSSGMGALVATLKTVKAAGGELALCSLTEQVQIIFELSKMNRIFQVFEDRKAFEAKYSVTAS